MNVGIAGLIMVISKLLFKVIQDNMDVIAKFHEENRPSFLELVKEGP